MCSLLDANLLAMAYPAHNCCKQAKLWINGDSRYEIRNGNYEGGTLPFRTSHFILRT